MKKLLTISLILLMILGGCSVKSADEYYKETESKGTRTVTLTVNCDTAVKYQKGGERVRGDILTDYEVSIGEGDTVFDALKKACKKKQIQFEYQGSGDSLYIRGIDYLYEFECGDLSGWEYCVNGKFPDKGCNSVTLSDGDVVKWLYTCDLGADIGNKYKVK
jgi:hypothetical protein